MKIPNKDDFTPIDPLDLMDKVVQETLGLDGEQINKLFDYVSDRVSMAILGGVFSDDEKKKEQAKRIANDYYRRHTRES